MDVLELADRLWRGDDSHDARRPLGADHSLVEVTSGVAFLTNFANCSIFDTDEGLVMVDTGSPLTASRVYDEVRAWRKKPLHTVVFSHGHIDHVFGVGPFDEEAAANNAARPRVVAHHALPRRFERYLMTRGYNQIVNRRQFGLDNLEWPDRYRFPDLTYESELDLIVGGRTWQLRHEMGETDDATVTWLSELGVLCTGDLFIWNSPNAGNPQKVQRYPLEWAQALRRMVALEARFLLPGHGLPIVGAQRVAQALSETAEYLESLVTQTLALMNEGARLSDTLASVVVPAHLAGRPYLQPHYDEPEFVVRNIWRLYGGWWDGNPANLRPARDRRLAEELAELAGGAGALATRAETLVGRDDDEARRLAGHLAEMAWLASPEDPAIRATRQRVFHALADAATSTMSRGVYSWAERESNGAHH